MHRWLQVLTLPGVGISPGAASAAAADTGQPRQLGSGNGQRGSHHYTVVLLLPSQACCQLARCTHRMLNINCGPLQTLAPYAIFVAGMNLVAMQVSDHERRALQQLKGLLAASRSSADHNSTADAQSDMQQPRPGTGWVKAQDAAGIRSRRWPAGTMQQ